MAYLGHASLIIWVQKRPITLIEKHDRSALSVHTILPFMLLMCMQVAGAVTLFLPLFLLHTVWSQG